MDKINNPKDNPADNTQSGYEEIYEATQNVIDNTARVHHNVSMGKGNVIMEGAIIREGVQLGDNNIIGPYCIIGDAPEKTGWFDRPGKVIIGNNNRLTKQVTIDASTDGVTIITNNVTILKNAHVGHDAHIMDGVVLSCNACVGGHTIVGRQSNFGLGAVVHQRLTVPEGVMVGMNSTITKKTKLEPWRKYAGSPARDIGSNIKGE